MSHTCCCSGDFEGTDEDDGFLHDDKLMMWDDGEDLMVPPGSAREEVAQLVAGLDNGHKEELKNLLARSANGTAPESLHQDMLSILSTSQSYSTDSYPATNLHVLIDDHSNAFDPSTLQYLREAMLSDGAPGSGGGLEPMSISSKSDRSDAVRLHYTVCFVLCDTNSDIRGRLSCVVTACEAFRSCEGQSHTDDG